MVLAFVESRHLRCHMNEVKHISYHYQYQIFKISFGKKLC